MQKKIAKFFQRQERSNQISINLDNWFIPAQNSASIRKFSNICILKLPKNFSWCQRVLNLYNVLENFKICYLFFCIKICKIPLPLPFFRFLFSFVLSFLIYLFVVLKPATLLKLTLLHGCFSRFLNCTNRTKSLNAPQVCARFSYLYSVFIYPQPDCEQSKSSLEDFEYSYLVISPKRV